MRARFIFSFFVALFISTSAIYANTLRWGDILLEGELTDVGSRSIRNTPIKAFLDDDNTLYIEFSRVVTDINIIVKDSQGKAVYSNSTVASATNCGTSVSVAGYAPGTYTLEFTNSDGGYLQGFFIVE